MNPPLPYKIFFIGDSAATIDFGNLVDEKLNEKIISLFDHLSLFPLEGMTEAIPAYSSLTVFYDIHALRKKIPPWKEIYSWIENELHKLVKNDLRENEMQPRVVRIPVCYEKEFGIDLQWMATEKNISQEEIIRLHTVRHYRVYMLGFLPGFAYMGEVDEKIALPRKQQPGQVIAGSVGIAGKQTGIYPLDSPGGWQIIGRTPVRLFDPDKEEPCLLRAGDQVEFYSIIKNEFENYQSGHA